MSSGFVISAASSRWEDCSFNPFPLVRGPLSYYPFLMQEFLIGLGIGLVVAAIASLYLSTRIGRVRKEKEEEIARFKDMLSARMELESEGLKKVREENEELKKANENLRVSLMAMREKPGRKEAQKLQIMQKAVDRLMLNSPGFATAWQVEMHDSEEEFQKMYSGIVPFIKRHIPGRSEAQLVDAREGDEDISG